MENPAADRLGLQGVVCTADPRNAGFDVKVVFLVDVASGPLFSSYDLEGTRLNALRETFGRYGGNESISFAVVAFAAVPRLLAPREGYFTRNPAELQNAVASLALPQGCAAGVCRAYGSAVLAARSLIEADMAALNAGQRSRTQYAVVPIVAGPQSPRTCLQACCNPQVQQCSSGCTPSRACTVETLRADVEALREDVEGAGAASLSFHAVLLAALAADQSNAEEIDEAEESLKQMAFAGAGVFERFNSADSITLGRIDFLQADSMLQAKQLLVTNASVLPADGGPHRDGDGDGLDDLAEEAAGTRADEADTDQDGIGDFLEVRLDTDPLVAQPPPEVCDGLDGPPYLDADADRLNACEELVLGTDPSLTDSDGDGFPDGIEAVFGTDYLQPDGLDDSDWDGAPNGNELLSHTDPRASDLAEHLANAYRYDLEDLGVVSEPVVSLPRRLTGIDAIDAGPDTTGGLGELQLDPGPPATLRWRDAGDRDPGPPHAITTAGIYRLLPHSGVTGSGDLWLDVTVEPVLLPISPVAERLRVYASKRHCVGFKVRNIRLLEGDNDIFLYLGQAPEGRLTSPGIYRVAHIPVTYSQLHGRTPADVLVEVRDLELVTVGD